MAQTPDVLNGFLKTWLNYDRRHWQRQITVSDTRAGVVAAAVVILLALAVPAAYTIVNRFIVRAWTWLERLYHQHQARRRSIERQNPVNDPGAESNERTPLVPRQPPTPPPTTLPLPPRCSYQARIRETWKVSKTPDFALVELGKLGWELLTHGPEEASNDGRRPNDAGEYYTGFKKSNLWARIWEVVLLVFLVGFCLGAFGLFIWGSIASGTIISDSAALADGQDCGFWIPDSSAPRKENGTYGYYYLQELDAGEYARKCYGAPDGADGCNVFVSQDMPYTEIDKSLCPFSDELCLNGRFSALRMTTPLLSSKMLGINVPTGYLFNRSTTCAPVKRVGFVKENGTNYEYNYGPIPGLSNSTWTFPKAKPRTVPGYEVATICYEEGSRNYWEPIPAFSSHDYTVTTLMLIQSQNNYHRFPSTDPIFPATTPLVPAKSIPLYINEDPIATALACVDQLSICTHDGKTCWTDANNPLKEIDLHLEKTGYYMLNIALGHSNVCNSIYMRGGSALDAHSKVPFSLNLPISIPLAPEQWKVEARALFESSLARIQIDLRDHMRGAAANEIGFANHIDSAYMDMCSNYKFRAVGWRNVNAWAFRLLLLLVICVYLLSFETQWWSEEPELIAESLWDFTVLKLLRKMEWMPADWAIEDDVAVEGGAEDMNGVENGHDDAEEEAGPKHVVGEASDDEDVG